MNKKIAVISFLIVAVLLVSAIAVTMVHFIIANAPNPKQSDDQSQVSAQTSTLRAQILSLNDQLANLTNLVGNLTSANLVTSLETHEMIGANSSYMGELVSTPVPFNYLWVTGSVTNTGKGYALDAGLQVTAYSSSGTLEINVTLPFIGKVFGTDNATNAFVAQKYGKTDLSLEILDGKQTTNIDLNIFHEGLIANWTLTPVCWDSATLSIVNKNESESLSSQILDLNNRISSAKAIIANLTTANVVASLGIKAYPASSQDSSIGNSLYIVGSVTNVGDAVAYNAGLRVVAYTSSGNLEINTTFPLSNGGVTYNIDNYVSPTHLSALNSGYGFDFYTSSNSASLGMVIYTPNLVSNWTVTPVWTNSP